VQNFSLEDSVERKIEVYRVIKGGKIQPIAREGGLDRVSIYLWKESLICFNGSS